MMTVIGVATWLVTFVGLVARRRYCDRRRGEAGWRPTGLRLTTPETYDQARAIARAQAARTTSPTGRPYRSVRARPTPVDFFRRKTPGGRL